MSILFPITKHDAILNSGKVKTHFQNLSIIAYSIELNANDYEYAIHVSSNMNTNDRYTVKISLEIIDG